MDSNDRCPTRETSALPTRRPRPVVLDGSINPYLLGCVQSAPFVMSDRNEVGGIYMGYNLYKGETPFMHMPNRCITYVACVYVTFSTFNVLNVFVEVQRWRKVNLII